MFWHLKVPYDSDGFMEKNRDQLTAELMHVMISSQDEFISDLFTVKRGPTGTISAYADSILHDKNIK